MAVDPASLTGSSALTLSGDNGTSGASPSNESGPRKIDPNIEDEILQVGIEGFVATMMSNQLLLNGGVFNFAKEAIDEADQ